MANAEHLEVVARGACAVDEWRRAHPAARLQLDDADLSGQVFDGWNLGRAILDGADLRGCSFQGTDLSETWMRRADLTGANLRNAVLLRANLAGADLRDADLRNAQMYRCILRDAIINPTTTFAGAHVAKVVWPDAVRDGVGGISKVGWG